MSQPLRPLSVFFVVLALQAAVGAPQEGTRGPLKEADVVFLLQSGVPPARVRSLVERYGIDFEVTPRVLEIVRAAGGDPPLLEALRAGSVSKRPVEPAPPTPSPSPRRPAASPPGPRPTERAQTRTSPYEPETVLIPGGPKGDFFLGKYEVTNKLYLAFCERSGRPKPEPPFWGAPDDYPVVNVTWHDAVTFCRWLSLETGRSYRLPSEAEWEHGAQGGSRSPRTYPWGSEDPVGRSCFGRGALCPVGSFKPNGFGLHDMAGSVAEWCQDLVTPGSKARVIRGGSWASPLTAPEVLAIVHRDKLDPEKARNEVGFRVARDR